MIKSRSSPVWLLSATFLMYTATVQGQTASLGNFAPVNTGWAGAGILSPQNTGYGFQAFRNTSGTIANTAVGKQALWSNSQGENNTAIGNYALYLNNNGSLNVAVGFESLKNNKDGHRNTALGYQTLFANTLGTNNSAAGYQALWKNTTGSNNSACGYGALDQVATGNGNTAIGHKALTRATGSDNTGAGYNAGWGLGNFPQNYNRNVILGASSYNNPFASTADDNVVMGKDAAADFKSFLTECIAIGTRALYKSFNGSAANSQNVAIGLDALGSTVGGHHNTAVGAEAMRNNVSGINNVAVGYQAAYNHNIGFGAVALGAGAMHDHVNYFSTSGDYNTAVGPYSMYTGKGMGITSVGYSSDVDPTNTKSYITAYGYNTVETRANVLRIGEVNTLSSIETQVAYVAASDARLKYNVKDSTILGTDFIMKLRPVTYNLNGQKANEILRSKSAPVTAAKPIQLDAEVVEASKNKRHTGFLAQEVETAAKELNYKYAPVNVPQESNELYGINYNGFVMPLVKTIQEQQELIAGNQKMAEVLARQLLVQDDAISKAAAYVTAERTAGNTISIRAASAPGTNAELLDLNMATVHSGVVNHAGDFEVPGAQLNAGLYYVMVTDQGKISEFSKVFVSPLKDQTNEK